MTTTLPFELLEVILCRLPVKSLKRFRCVAKSWCSLIDSDRFIKSHWQRSLATKSHHHYLLQGPDGVLSISFDSPKKAHTVKLPFSYKSTDGFSNSCNGLVIIRCKHPALWNPFTREFKVLPDINDGYTDPPNSFSAIMYGLAYDSRNDDYKVVRIKEHMRSGEGTWMSSRADIYSLKSDSWRRVENFPYPLPFFRETWRGHVNGALHTIVGNPNTIKAFTVETEKHSELEMPLIILKKGINLTLHAVGGCLSIVCTIRSHVEFWVMKVYGVTGSWTRIFSLSADSFNNLHLMMHSDDAGKVMVYHHDLLCWYDLVNSTKDVIDIPGKASPCVYYGEACVESLVLLNNRETNAQGKTKGKKMSKKKDDFLSVGFKLVL